MKKHEKSWEIGKNHENTRKISRNQKKSEKNQLTFDERYDGYDDRRYDMMR
jgi:hypothetical protein